MRINHQLQVKKLLQLGGHFMYSSQPIFFSLHRKTTDSIIKYLSVNTEMKKYAVQGNYGSFL